MSQTVLPRASEIHYPESDGLPMADNTLQWQWITTIKENLELLFEEDPQVFVAGDLLWYPVEGAPAIRTAPDVLVAFGRPKGHRGSYMQWREENIPPQVVFEILSPGNSTGEMVSKGLFCEHHGVEEWYLYDPDKHELTGMLRSGSRLEQVPQMDGWVSPRLGVRFTQDTATGELRLFRPDGEPFLTFLELAARAKAERKRADAAVSENERLRARLLALGVDPDAPTS